MADQNATRALNGIRRAHDAIGGARDFLGDIDSGGSAVRRAKLDRAVARCTELRGELDDLARLVEEVRRGV